MAKKEPSKKYLAAKEKLMAKGIRTHNDFLKLVKNQCAVDEDPAVAKILNIIQENVTDKYSLRRLIDLVRDREEFYKNLIKLQRGKIEAHSISADRAKDEVKAERAEKGVILGAMDAIRRELLKKDEIIAKLNEYSRTDIVDIPDEIDRSELLDFEEGAPEIVQDLGGDDDLPPLDALDDSSYYDDDYFDDDDDDAIADDSGLDLDW